MYTRLECCSLKRSALCSVALHFSHSQAPQFQAHCLGTTKPIAAAVRETSSMQACSLQTPSGRFFNQDCTTDAASGSRRGTPELDWSAVVQNGASNKKGSIKHACNGTEQEQSRKNGTAWNVANEMHACSACGRQLPNRAAAAPPRPCAALCTGLGRIRCGRGWRGSHHSRLRNSM